MAVVAAVLAVVLSVLVFVVGPIRARDRFRRLRARVDVDPGARVDYYRRGITRSLVITAALLACALVAGETSHGLRFVRTDGAALLVCLVAFGSLVAGVLLMQERLAVPERRARMAAQLHQIEPLLPRTPEERRMWTLVSLTAGVTEEIVFRAFPMIVLTHFFDTDFLLPFVLIPAVAFGFAHLYQGRRGVAATTLAGVALGVIVITAGLLPAMILHVLIDLRLLLIPREVFDEARTATDRATMVRTRSVPRLVAAVVLLAAVVWSLSAFAHRTATRSAHATADDIAALLHDRNAGCDLSAPVPTRMALPMPTSAVRCSEAPLQFTIETYATASDLARVRARDRARCPLRLVLGTEVDGANWRAYPDPFSFPSGQEQVWNAVAPRIARVAGGDLITAVCTS